MIYCELVNSSNATKIKHDKLHDVSNLTRQQTLKSLNAHPFMLRLKLLVSKLSLQNFATNVFGYCDFVTASDLMKSWHKVALLVSFPAQLKSDEARPARAGFYRTGSDTN